MLNEPPGSHDICSICFWEDDNIQLRWPDYAVARMRFHWSKVSVTTARSVRRTRASQE